MQIHIYGCNYSLNPFRVPRRFHRALNHASTTSRTGITLYPPHQYFTSRRDGQKSASSGTQVCWWNGKKTCRLTLVDINMNYVRNQSQQNTCNRDMEPNILRPGGTDKKSNFRKKYGKNTNIAPGPWFLAWMFPTHRPMDRWQKMLNKSINWHSRWKWNQTKGKNQHLWHLGIQVCRHIDPNIWIVLRFSFNTDFQWLQCLILKSVYRILPPFERMLQWATLLISCVTRRKWRNLALFSAH